MVAAVFQDGEWWFCAKDVCAVLEISKYRDAVSSLDTTQRSSIRVDTPGGQQLTTFVSEYGLYELIFKSFKPEAKKFKTYVLDLIKSHRKGEILTLEQLNAALDQQKAELNAENLKLIEALAKQHETLQVVESMFDLNIVE